MPGNAQKTIALQSQPEKKEARFERIRIKSVQPVADIPVLKSLVIHLPNQIRCEIREEISSNWCSYVNTV